MNDTKALTLYPDQQEIDTLQHRIRDLLPGAAKFSDAVLTAFAQISLAHNLDPFIGEIWIIPTKRGPRIRAGIEGHRKAAHKQSAYQLRQRPMRQEEFEQHGLKLGQIGAVSEIYRRDSQLEQAYIPTLGYGIWSPGNPKAGIKPDRIPHTKTAFWVALKRSEQDALRKAFDLPFVGEENGNAQPLPAHVGPPGDPPAPGSVPTPPPEPPGSAHTAAAELYGDWDGEVFAAGENDPPPEPQEEIVDATATRIVNTQTGEITEQPDEEPPLDKWGSFRSPAAAITWATRQGAFDNVNDARHAYDTLKADALPKNAQAMAQLWLAAIAYQLEKAGA